VPAVPDAGEAPARTPNQVKPQWLVIVTNDDLAITRARASGYVFVDTLLIFVAGQTLLAGLFRVGGHVLFGTGLAIDASRIGPGRWPTNLLFVHNAECRRQGSRQVRGDPRSARGQVLDGKRPKGFFNVGSDKGSSTPGARVYGDASGFETIEDYACVEGCPVGMLSRMEDGSSRFFPNLVRSELWPWLERLVGIAEEVPHDA